jgi:hypothetical protein
MEMLTITSAILLFIATSAILCLLVHVKAKSQISIDLANKSCIEAAKALDDCKKLIAAIQEAHNGLTKQTADTARQLSDVKFFLDAQKKR